MIQNIYHGPDAAFKDAMHTQVEAAFRYPLAGCRVDGTGPNPESWITNFRP